MKRKANRSCPFVVQRSSHKPSARLGEPTKQVEVEVLTDGITEIFTNSTVLAPPRCLTKIGGQGAAFAPPPKKNQQG